MSTTPTDNASAPDEFKSHVWNQLSECVDAFIGAWDKAVEPPSIGDFVPMEQPAIRKLILSELVKVDLEYRWRNKRFPKLLEDYLVEFPEMAESGFAPVDLVYEEYHVRRQAGDDVEPAAYFKRFPTQETELRRLLKLESPNVTTTLIRGSAQLPINLGDQIDDFDLLTELGKGAFACVYLARQRSMQRMVALKVSADKGAEPQTLAQLDHPNIVRVYDQRQLPDRKLRLLYMQYVPGGTLEGPHEHLQRLAPVQRNGQQFLNAIDRVLDERGESPPTDSSTREKISNASWPQVVCWLGSKLAAALAYAHRQGVLHRDLKPANVLIAADGNPKLADFNISFASKLEGATPAAYFGGSLAYMSPEQLEACNPSHEREPDSLDGRADVYSLGVLLWELLTGSRPFPDEKPTNNWTGMLTTMVARRTAGMNAPTFAKLPPDCPAGLRESLSKCLTPNLEARVDAAAAARMFEICLQPRAQKLLHGPQSRWRAIVGNYPTLTVVVAIVAVNLVLSVLNIVYNVAQILRDFNVTQEQFFSGPVPIINTVCYSLGIGTVLSIGWSVFTAVRPNPPPLTAGALTVTRARCLRLGDYLAVTVIALWVASGIILPPWLTLMRTQADAPVRLASIVHFFLSQCLCGLIATTMSYFILTFIGVRYFYPRLIARELPEHSDVDQLAGLSRRIWLYYLLAVAAPFLAALLLMSQFSPAGAAESGNLKLFIMFLIVLGLVGFGMAYYFDRAIRDDLSALAQIVNPAGSTLAGTETTESFMTGSRSDTFARRKDETQQRK